MLILYCVFILLYCVFILLYCVFILLYCVYYCVDSRDGGNIDGNGNIGEGW
jgi:hypothetical protein